MVVTKIDRDHVGMQKEKRYLIRFSILIDDIPRCL